MIKDNIQEIDLSNPSWRLNNLYRIVSRDAASVAFRLNHVQQDVIDNLHTRNVILKARQLGMSTFSVLYILDHCLFNNNISAGIVSYSLEHAQYIFKRIIGHALDTLTPMALSLAGIKQRSAREISFANGSMLRVDTTLRGGAYQAVLVSEFGKTCARNPIKAEEVITGTLNTLSQDSLAIIESTAEGSEGYFSDMVNTASLHHNIDLTPLDYKLFFYSWTSEPSYALSSLVQYDKTLEDYFDKIEAKTGLKINQQQRFWYAKQYKLLGEKMKQEFPSTISEAFTASSDAFYFQACIDAAYNDKRMIYNAIYDALEPVYVACDIGATDLTVLVFFQVVHGEIKVIDYYSDNNKGVDFYCRFLQQDKRYLYQAIFLPHDAKQKDRSRPENVYERDFKNLFAHTPTQIITLTRQDKNLNIANAKTKFERCAFDLRKTKPLVDHLAKYRKKWSEQFGRYIDEPLHDENSHFADAFRYAMQAVSHLEAAGGIKGALDRHRNVVAQRKYKI